MSFLEFMAGLKWFFIVFLPFIVLTLLVETIKKIFNWIIESRVRAAGVDEVDKMDGKYFEIWLAHQFRRAGYAVKRTRYQKDHGADLIVTSKKGNKIAVQAKKLGKNKSNVGVKALGEVLRGKKYYNCDQAMVVTNQSYTEQAQNEADRFGIELIDRNKLIDMVQKINHRVK